MSKEQKPKVCSRCGRPVALAYRVIKREFDAKRGEWFVAKGQYEVAHIGPDERPVWDMCPYPSLLEQYQERIRREQAAADTKREAEGGGSTEYQGSGTRRRIIHFEEAGTALDGRPFTRVRCGAKGNLWTTLDSETVTCSNCKPKPGQIAFVQAKGNPVLDRGQVKEPSPWSGEVEVAEGNLESVNQIKEVNSTMSTTAEAIKNKIKGGAAKQGASANLTGAGTVADGDGVPLPKATTGGRPKVEKKAVQTMKAEKAPKVLNACGCGCNQPCKANFLPGHDAKLHGWVKKVAAGTLALSELPAQVQAGMYPKVKQGVIKSKNEKGEVVETLQGVAPSVQEAAYLETLKGLGGPAA